MAVTISQRSITQLALPEIKEMRVSTHIRPAVRNQGVAAITHACKQSRFQKQNNANLCFILEG